MGDFALTPDGVSPLREQILKVLLASSDPCMTTRRVARDLREPTWRVREQLHRLETDGLVRVMPGWGAINNLAWAPVRAAGTAVRL